MFGTYVGRMSFIAYLAFNMSGCPDYDMYINYIISVPIYGTTRAGWNNSHVESH